MAAIQTNERDPSVSGDGGPNLIRQLKIHANQVEANDGDLLTAIAQDQGASEQIVMYTVAALDRSQ